METAKFIQTKLTAVYIPCEEGGYAAFIEEIPGVNTQGDTLEEAKKNLKEALELVLEVRHELAEKEIHNKKAKREYIELRYETDGFNCASA